MLRTVREVVLFKLMNFVSETVTQHIVDTSVFSARTTLSVKAVHGKLYVAVAEVRCLTPALNILGVIRPSGFCQL